MRPSIALAVSFLKVAAAFQLVDGAQVIGAGMLRGLHDTRWPLIFAFVGYWGIGLGIGALACVQPRLAGRRHLDRPRQRPRRRRRLMLWRWIMRERLGLTRRRMTNTLARRR